MTLQFFVTGRMGAGKDVFADYLVSKHGFVKTAFADGIRRFIRDYDPTYKPKSDRGLEIDVGNTMRRWFGDSVWIDEALVELANKSLMSRRFEPPQGKVISDGRFPLEYEICVRQCGFIHIHINADAFIRKQRLLLRDGTFNADHFYSPDDCQIPIGPDTYVIENNGTLEELYAKIDAFLVGLQAYDGLKEASQ